MKWVFRSQIKICEGFKTNMSHSNPYPAKLNNLNFQQLEVASQSLLLFDK